MKTQLNIQFESVNHGSDILTPNFLAFLAQLQQKFQPRIATIRSARAQRLRIALTGKSQPSAPAPSEATSEPWLVPKLPETLQVPGIEISGPASIAPMMVQALNPGPEGERAAGYLDDDEDSGGHSLNDTIQAAINRKAALQGSLTFDDVERGKKYRVQSGALPFFMHRERGLYLDEPAITIDGHPVSATVLGIALTLYHCGRLHGERGESINFYLPKCESVDEVSIYRDLFEDSQRRLAHLAHAPIRAIILIESLPAALEMEEMLFALGPYAAGLNAARWDLKASLIEYVLTDPKSVWPDRFDVDIKSTPFLANLFRRLVAVCLKHGAVPIGGMATALPNRDQTVNRQAADAIRADKEWEARQGFLRAWVAHIYHMQTAARAFIELDRSGWKPSSKMADPSNYPLKIEVPEGAITEAGTRRNARTIIEYLEGWMRGRGAKGIDSLAGRAGSRPALMEDLATARISIAQTAQRLIHESRSEDTNRLHTQSLVKSILKEECADIIGRLGSSPDSDSRSRYECSLGIALRWIRNYLELDVRSLGTYSRDQLLQIGQGPDAF